MDPELQRALNELSEQIKSTEARLNDRIETVETRLLTEFHKWASPMETRVHSHSAVMRALDLEMEYLREKVQKLENGKS